MNKQQLASKIWASANKMRSKIEANEYKDYILGFIFYKFLSDKEIKYLKANDWTDADLPELTEDDTETVESVRRNIGYFIAYKDLFSTWLSMGPNFTVGNVRDALNAFARLVSDTHKKVFEKIFDTLQTGLSKLGDTSGTQTKAISDLISLIKDIPMDGRQDYDVLGFIYEYLISNFAANAGKKAGEFYTPHEVSLLMSEIVAHHLQGRKHIEIYDPTSGSGSLLINIGQSAAKYMQDRDKIKYYAQELKENTYNLTRMNLVMRGIKPENIVPRNGDTLEDDWPLFDDNDPVNTYTPLYVDAVVSNPPYSQHWDSKNKEADPRFKSFGLAPKSKADYAFLLHDLFHLKPDGIMTIVLPHGVLFRGKPGDASEGDIRKNLVERNNIDAIIGLPAGIFFGTGIPTIIMVLRQKRANEDVLFIDASKGFEKAGKNNKLLACHIRRIVDAYVNRAAVERFCRPVSRDEIRANDYNLNIPRYVDSSEPPQSHDIYASMFGGIPPAELDSLDRYWTAFPGLREALFVQDPATGYYAVREGGSRTLVRQHPEVKHWQKDMVARGLQPVEDAMQTRLVHNILGVPTEESERAFGNMVIECAQKIALLDPYEAYQIFADQWQIISTDVEILQTEGEQAATRVEPNMVVKKKGEKEIEVQDGWIGRVLPFGLVQQELLADRVRTLAEREQRLGAIDAELAELFDALDQEDKETLGNEAKNEEDSYTEFAPARVTAAAKEVRADLGKDKPQAGSVEETILRAEKLLKEKKETKSALAKERAALEKTTKETIEGLDWTRAVRLLEAKWIRPLMARLNGLADTALDELVRAVEELAGKYATTLADVQADIAATEKELAVMLGQLTGNDKDMQGIAKFAAMLGGE